VNVLVYTMGKVGSTTVMRALRSAGHVVGRGYPGNISDLDLSFYDVFVTMARDPIVRNIAQMFETEMEQGVDSIAPMVFFDDWLYPILKIDVYATKFPKAKGWKIYNNELLVIKTEKLSDALGDALTALCGEADYQVEHRAMGAIKYGPEYTEYLEKASFDSEFLDQMYESKYMKHFYLAKEVQKFRVRWSG